MQLNWDRTPSIAYDRIKQAWFKLEGSENQNGWDEIVEVVLEPGNGSRVSQQLTDMTWNDFGRLLSMNLKTWWEVWNNKQGTHTTHVCSLSFTHSFSSLVPSLPDRGSDSEDPRRTNLGIWLRVDAGRVDDEETWLWCQCAWVLLKSALVNIGQ